MRRIRSVILFACATACCLGLPRVMAATTATEATASATTASTAPATAPAVMPSDGLPLEPFERGPGRDLLGQPVALNAFSNFAAKYFGSGKSLAIEAPTDHFNPIAIAPEF